jgi:glycosyltransferase involved in cell wall biosynthesis
MERMGHVSEALTVDDPQDAFLKEIGVKVHAVGPGSKPFGYTPKLKSWVRKNAREYDIVIFHTIWDYCTPGSYYQVKRLGIPMVTFPHGMLDPYFNRNFPLKRLKKQLYWNWGAAPVIRDSVLTLFTTEEEKILARESFRPYQPKEHVISYGVPDPQFDCAEARIAFFQTVPVLGNKRYLLYLSRIHPKKGCDLLVQAFAHEMKESDLDLVIAGPDETGIIPQLQAIAQKVGIADRIHFPGMLKGNQKWGAYLGAEAFILPSHQENFGQVVAEAMALSRPVLISDKVNIFREVSASGGGLVEPDTLAGTRSLLRRFSNLTPDQRSQIGAAARIGFETHFEGTKSIIDFVAAVSPHVKPKS